MRVRRRGGAGARVAARAAAVLASLALLGACTGEVVLEADPATEVSAGASTTGDGDGVTILEGGSAGQLAIAASQAYFASAGIVVLTPADAGQQLRGASIAAILGLPVLVADEDGVAAELERLETHTVLVLGGVEVPELSEDRPFLRAVPAPDRLDALQVVIGRDLSGETAVAPGGEVAALAELATPSDRLLVLEGEQASQDVEPTDGESENLADVPGLPPFLPAAPLTTDALVTDGGPGQIAAVGTARAAGAGVVVTDDGLTDPAAVEALGALEPRRVVGIGDVGPPEDFSYRARVAASGVELPGGGQELVGDKIYVGLRGAPGAPELGSLGAQDVPATIARLDELAATSGASGTAVPTAVLLTTVASATPGSDGSYSGKRSLEDVISFVDAAEEGV
ncbi:hypothetical protein GCM10025875_09140 [Litorihabitans aurantiacus]|uniref:Cell wall-binding repeat-containing protein n=1 Tax=Litorihabitans aurantiacus TaxID=1930061 RepID=A0AA37UWV3_9MICO|nr:hypothetical protein GCM10025875_09140 [Litorihabitans aurantiacus]